MKIIDIANVIDSLHSTPKYSVEGYPMVRVVDVNNGFIKLDKCLKVDWDTFIKHTKNHMPQKGDIIITRVGSFGLLGFVNSDVKFCLGQNIAIINPKKNAKFLYYYLQSPFMQKTLYGNIGGSAYKSIGLEDIRNLPYEDLGLEVEKIGDFLYLIDSKIDLNNKVNAELELMAKTLYNYWFVQFDFPNELGKPYKSSGGKMVWSEELKREIPEGWVVKLLGTEIEIQRGVSYTSKEINGDGIPMISLNSFNLNGTYKPEGIKNYSGKYTDKNNTKPGDLLIAATDVTRNADIIGRAILVPDYYYGDLVFSMDIAKIISKNIPSSFMMMLFNSNHYHNYIKWYATGTIILHLNLDGINRYQTELPPIGLMEKFDEFFLPITNRIYNTTKENQKLVALKDWLLPMLMNRQVQIN